MLPFTIKTKTIVFVMIMLVEVKCDDEEVLSNIGTAITSSPMCSGSTIAYGTFETGKSPEDENQYDVTINKKFSDGSRFSFMFDDEASVKLKDKSYARLTAYGDTFYLTFFRPHNGVSFVVKGQKQGRIPYFKSIIINNSERCVNPEKGMFDNYLEGYSDFAASDRDAYVGHSRSCGRRQIDHTALIVNGAATRPGEWPWHVAIYRLEKSVVKYICGGTLISNKFVLTAAHCVTLRGEPMLPEIFSVVLGKFNLIGGDLGSEEREVYKIIVHEEFSNRILDNDIALLKLRSEVKFSDYIQPACLWTHETDSLPRYNSGDYGTVVGWGFDHTDVLSTQLQKAVLPKLSDVVCVRNNPLFYGKVLTGKKFCAGFQNGTSPCNGDSGGGFVIFIPDESGNSSNPAGSWFVRGIVSLTLVRHDVPLCDPQQNAVFTDTAKYETWIEQNIRERNTR